MNTDRFAGWFGGSSSNAALLLLAATAAFAAPRHVWRKVELRLQASTEHPRPTTNTVRVAGIVLRWLRGDKEANYRRVEPLIREAAAYGAQIVCTTECFLSMLDAEEVFTACRGAVAALMRVSVIVPGWRGRFRVSCSDVKAPAFMAGKPPDRTSAWTTQHRDQ